MRLLTDSLRMMTIDHLFQAYVDNVHTITLGFALGTLTLVVIYLLNALKDDGFATESVGAGNVQQIEDMLKKLMEGAKLSGGPVAPAVSAQPASTAEASASAQSAASGERPVVNVIDSEEVNKLKVQLAERDQKLGELEAAFAKVLRQAAEKGSEDDLKSLQMQVKDLEAKLAEYEIIEDDIANLTTYKEENVKLKDEISRMKGGGASASALPDVAANPSEAPGAVDEALMAEFEAAVDEQKQGVAATPISVGPAVGTGPESSQATPPTAVDDALMKEFANAVKPTTPPSIAESVPVAPEVVTPSAEDPMLKAEVAKETGELPESLNTQFDPDTMLSEVQAIDVNAPARNDGQDEGEKLIAEFENFMDKN